MCKAVDLLFSNTSVEVAYGRISPTAASGTLLIKQINLIRPTVLCKSLKQCRANCQNMDQIWENNGRGVPRFEAAVLRDAWICQRTPACYRLNSPFCLPMVLAHTSAVYSLSVLTHNRLLWLSCSFIISASFFDHFPLCWLRDLSNFSCCGMFASKCTPQTEYVLCLFFFFFTMWAKQNN